ALTFNLPDYSDPSQFSYPNNPAPVPAWPATDAQAIVENSACLAIVLELLGSLDELASNEKNIATVTWVPNPQNLTPNVPVIVDGWGTPLMYDFAPGNPGNSVQPGPNLAQTRLAFWVYRLRQQAALAFPAKYPGAPGQANSDPDDPDFLLQNL